MRRALVQVEALLEGRIELPVFELVRPEVREGLIAGYQFDDDKPIIEGDRVPLSRVADHVAVEVSSGKTPETIQVVVR